MIPFTFIQAHSEREALDRVRQPNTVFIAGGTTLIDLMKLNVERGETAELMKGLEARVRGLHPALRDVRLSHRWGGPILIADKWQPIVQQHPRNKSAIVLGAYSGHGVALSVYLCAWAAEAMLGKRNLPDWNPEENPED